MQRHQRHHALCLRVPADRRRGDKRQGLEAPLNSIQAEPHATALDLPVPAPNQPKVAIAQPIPTVTGTVHARAWSCGRRHEAIGGARGIPQIPAAESNARRVDIPFDERRSRMQVPVQNHQLAVGDGTPDMDELRTIVR